MKKTFLLILVFSFNFIYAQENTVSPFLTAGRASDNDAIGNFGGGGGGLQCWEAGPIFRLGIEYNVNTSLSTQGYISYSFYRYDGSVSYGEKSSSGYNNILDIMSIVEWKIGIFNMKLGAGVSQQFNDEIRYLEENQYHEAEAFVQAKSKTVFAGQFGLGFDIPVYDSFSVLAEGDLFFREYLGSAWLLGFKYSLKGF